MTLPDRTEEAEDACVAAWTESDDTEGLEQLIEAAMAARRPMLDGRLLNCFQTISLTFTDFDIEDFFCIKNSIYSISN